MTRVVFDHADQPKYVAPNGIVYQGWRRELWGVVRYTKGTKDEVRSVIGQAWDDGFKLSVETTDCVPAPLLFASRRLAAAWCRGQQNKYALGRVQLCKEWRFTPVKVLDTTEVVSA